MTRLFLALAATLLFCTATWAETDQVSLDAQANALMEQGREALAGKKPAVAYELFNRVLLLPPNRYSQDAQEYAGLARERAGATNAAKKEYELYLRLYPEGEGADRVRQRLANLTPVTTTKLREVRAKPAESFIYGGISQYYYHGDSRIETSTTMGSITSTDTLTNTDQSALVTNIDITGRYRDERHDSRIVFRDTNTLNFNDVKDRNRMNAAYVETRDRQIDYSIRVGRQPGYHGGILGRFDGALLSYQALPKARIDLTVGKPVDFYSSYDKTFFGINIDLGTFAEHWGGAVYSMQQDVDGISDRKAVGGELRFFDAKRSLYSHVDYDTSYAVVNTFLLNGHWMTETNTTFNFMADRRKTPVMQTTNALIGESTSRIDTLLSTLSESEVRRYAEARTADATLYLVGVTQPLSPKWQVGGDARVSDHSGTTAAGTQPATPGTGKTWTYTAQAIGTGLFSKTDSNLFAVSLINGAAYDGHSIFVSNRILRGTNWAFDSALRWYAQEDKFSTRLSRITPTFRVGYHFTDRVTVESEIGYEQTTTKGTFASERTDRTFFYAGYRWMF